MDESQLVNKYQEQLIEKKVDAKARHLALQNVDLKAKEESSKRRDDYIYSVHNYVNRDNFYETRLHVDEDLQDPVDSEGHVIESNCLKIEIILIFFFFPFCFLIRSGFACRKPAL